jgi:hypothetical protein
MKGRGGFGLPVSGDLPPPKRSRLREARASAGVGRSCKQAQVAPTYPIPSAPFSRGDWVEVRGVIISQPRNGG